MSDHSRIFTYETAGLSYTVTVYEDPDSGQVLADIAVIDGAMDVNAVYFGDDDFSGDSAALRGPLNMNGARLEGEAVQWDTATELSRPGLGPEGTDKETYLAEGDVLTIELDAESLDEIDVFGIRATSTSTDDGSIKGVSHDPEEPEEPEEPIFDKVGFGTELDDNGGILGGVFVTEDMLPEGDAGTFEDYVNVYEDFADQFPEFGITEVEAVLFFDVVTDENGNDIPEEIFRIDAPEGGFQSTDELLAAYDEQIANGALDGIAPENGDPLELVAALSLGNADDAPVIETVEMPEDEIELA